MASFNPLFRISAQVVRLPGRLAGRSLRSRNASSRLCATVLLAAALCTVPALADTKTWTGAVDAFWSNAGNWTGGAPAAGDRLVFPVGAANPAMRNDYAVGTTFYDITWYGTGYTIIGNAFGLTNGISNSGTNTISVAVALSGGTASGGSLTFSGAMTLSGNVSVTGALNGAVTLTGNAKISGTVTGPVDLGANTLSLASGLISGAISGTGGVQLGTDYALARLTGVNSYTGPTIVALSPSYTYNNRAQIDGIQTGSAVTVALNPGWGNHRLSGSGSLGAVVVEPSGSCSSATDVNCNQLSPGQSDGSATGQMTTAGLQMKSNTRLILQLNGAIPGSGYDQLVVNGAVDFAGGPRLDVFLGYVPALGQVFRIVDNGGGAAVVGSFAGLAEGATLTSSYSVVLQVSYAGGDGNDVTLTATSVPKIWTGAVNGLWSEPGNWTGGVPGAGDVLQFPVSASSKSMTNDLFAGTVFNRIEWYGTGYTIIGNAFGLTNGISNSGTNTISVAVALSGGTASGGSLTFSGAMTLSGNVSVTGALNGAVTLTGNAKISGTVTGPVDLGANTLSLASGLISGAISGTGGVQLGTDYALARLTGVNSYTGPTIVALSPSYTYNNRAQIDGIQTGSAVTVALNPGWGNHRLSGSGSLGAVVVEPSGSCSSATDVNCNQLSPGQSDGSATGQMTTAGLQMKSNTRLILQLNGAIPGSGYDQLVVNGAVDFAGGPRLDVFLGYVPALGQVFRIVDNGGGAAVVGSFAGLAEGATLTSSYSVVLQVSYAGGDGNDVTLTATSVPKIWTGAVNGLWSEPGNWTGGVPEQAMSCSSRSRRRASR